MNILEGMKAENQTASVTQIIGKAHTQKMKKIARASQEKPRLVACRLACLLLFFLLLPPASENKKDDAAATKKHPPLLVYFLSLRFLAMSPQNRSLSVRSQFCLRGVISMPSEDEATYEASPEHEHTQPSRDLSPEAR